MKKRSPLFICLILLFSANSLIAQTADEILSKHIEAMGGLQKLKSLKTLFMDATINFNNLQIQTKVYRIHQKALRVNMNVMGKDGYRIITNDAGWVYMPFAGHTKAQPIGKADLAGIQDALDIQGLADYKQKGFKAEYTGKQSIKGKPCNVVKITKPNGKVTVYYFDDRYYVYMAEETSKSNGQESTQTTTYHSYGKTPDGIVYPSSWTNSEGETKVNKFEPNAQVNETLFKPTNL